MMLHQETPLANNFASGASELESLLGLMMPFGPSSGSMTSSGINLI